MRQLLDTHTLLWFLQDAPELSAAAAARIESRQAQNWVSIVSIWEMSIKISLDKLRVPYSLDEDLPVLLRKNSIGILGIDCTHLAIVSQLPFHHRDPFDRLLVAQAQVENLVIISRDPALDAYDISRLWT